MYRRRAESDIYIWFNYRITRIRASSSVNCNYLILELAFGIE